MEMKAGNTMYDYREHSQQRLVLEIDKALTDILKKSFCRSDKYLKYIRKGKLVNKADFFDEESFEKTYPGHPMALCNCSSRIRAAEQVLESSRNLKVDLPDKVLKKMHEVLFDCCFSVGENIAHSLFLVGKASSVPFLQTLVNTGSGLQSLNDKAKAALLRCRMKNKRYLNEDDKIIVIVSDRIDLCIALIEAEEKTGCRLYIPDSAVNGLFDLRCVLQIVDRWYMGDSSWNIYCEMLYNSGFINSDSNVPLIITDSNMQKSLNAFKYPLKPEGAFYFLESGKPDEVRNHVLSLLDTKQTDQGRGSN